MKRWERARRDLLKRLGVGLALLPALRTRGARAAPGDRRLLCVVHTGGYRQLHWRPMAGSLSTQMLPRSSAPLEPHKQDVIFLPELANPNHQGSAEGAYGTIFYGLPDRHPGPTPYATYAEPKGPTVDQVVAAALPGGRARTLALHVQTDLPPVPPVRSGLRCFWAGENQPIDPEGDPFAVYQRLFSGASPASPDPAVKRLILRRKSMLDYVGKSLERWKARLGTDDRQSAEAHLLAVRGAEQRLAALERPAAGCPGPAPTALPAGALGNPDLYPKILDAQMELAVAALHCGSAQVVTVQLSNATGANVNFGAFVPGIPARGTGFRSPYRNWSDLTHNPIAGGTDHKAIVDEWLMTKLAQLITRLKALPDLGGTLLDRSVVLWGSHMHDGETSSNAPKASWLLAGRCGGHFKTGQCAQSAGQPLTGVLTQICRAMGVPQSPFGPSLPGLEA